MTSRLTYRCEAGIAHITMDDGKVNRVRVLRRLTVGKSAACAPTRNECVGSGVGGGRASRC